MCNPYLTRRLSNGVEPINDVPSNICRLEIVLRIVIVVDVAMKSVLGGTSIESFVWEMVINLNRMFNKMK